MEKWIRARYQPNLPQDLVDAAREQADVAVIVLSRFSGEGWDREPVLYQEPDYPWPDELEMPKRAMSIFPRGDFYLTDAEQNMVRQVRAAFAQVVLVLNAGGVMDVSWFWEDDRIPSVLLAYQGGMEGGAAIAALLTGRANPCGKLPDTFARDLSDYPSTAHFHDSPHYVEYTEDIYVGYRYFETLPGAAERVCYPFGYGLSYTTFALETVRAGAEDGQIRAAVRVTNTGSRAGKEVVQLYYRAPWGLLQKPKRCLAAFQKTKLLEPGQCETVELSFAASDMASFDDLGKVAPSAWVLEKGRYALYVGTSVRDTVELDWAWEQGETAVVRTVSDSLGPGADRNGGYSHGQRQPGPLSPGQTSAGGRELGGAARRPGGGYPGQPAPAHPCRSGGGSGPCRTGPGPPDADPALCPGRAAPLRGGGGKAEPGGVYGPAQRQRFDPSAGGTAQRGGVQHLWVGQSPGVRGSQPDYRRRSGRSADSARGGGVYHRLALRHSAGRHLGQGAGLPGGGGRGGGGQGKQHRPLAGSRGQHPPKPPVRAEL